MATTHRLTVLAYAAAAFATAILAVPSAHAASCCVSEPHGSYIAAKGLGESAPLALDVSEAAGWHAFEFKRDGVWYIQVNDRKDQVRAIIGNIDTVFWTLPGGVDADRVSLPGRLLEIPAGAGREVVYRKPGLWLVAYSTARGVIWSIESPDGTR